VAPTPLDHRRLFLEPLLPDHLPRFETFFCGVSDLDSFLKDDAQRLHDAHVSFTYLAFLELENGRDDLVGYISLTTDALTLEQDEKCDLPPIAFSVLPALKIGRLATKEVAKTSVRGIGTFMMKFAFIKGLELAAVVGTRFLTVDALETAVGFYDKLGFVRNAARTYTKKKQYISMRLDLFAPQVPTWIEEPEARSPLAQHDGGRISA